MPQHDDYLSRRHERREAAQKKREAEAKPCCFFFESAISFLRSSDALKSAVS